MVTLRRNMETDEGSYIWYVDFYKKYGDLLNENEAISIGWIPTINGLYSLSFKTDKYENNKEIYNIPFTIFNKSLQAGEVDTFCNTFDIYPTICDLYGLEFNNGLTQGYSVFSEQIECSLMVSMMAGIFDDDYFTVTLDDYTAQNNSLDTNAKLAGFKQKINNFYEKQQYIEAYYRINYEEYIK